MEWPFRRFVKAFDASQRRELCDEWRNRKATHIAALFANTNLDDEKNDRPAIMQRLEESYDDVIVQIWNGGPTSEEKQAEEAEWTSPFMKAGRRAQAKTDVDHQIALVKSAGARVPSPQPPTLPGEAEIAALPA